MRAKALWIGTLLALVIVVVVLGVGRQLVATLTTMSETDKEWHYYPDNSGEKPVFYMVNTGIFEKIYFAPDQLLKLKVELKAPNAAGLPSQEEFDQLIRLEDQIEVFARSKGDWYVGRVSQNHYRTFYVYTTQDERSWSRQIERLAQESGYVMTPHFLNDPEHKGYLEELYPTPDNWQVIQDILVIENLVEHGDDGSTPRDIEHLACVPSKESAAFIEWAVSNGFTVDQRDPTADADGNVCLVLIHHGRVSVAELSPKTILLRQKSVEFGGKYDGWETEVVASED